MRRFFLMPAVISGLMILCFYGMAENTVSPDPYTPYIRYADSADIYINRQNWESAENAILRALREEPANPANPMLITNLGIVRNRLGHFGEAKESFDIVLSRMPTSTIALTGRAEAYIGLQKTSEALHDLETAIGVDSTLTLPLTMHGYLMLKEKHPAMAMKSFERLVQLDSLSAIGHAGKADCLAALGRNTEALEEYGMAVRSEDRPEWRFRSGLLLLDRDDIEGAFEQARNALSKDPRNGETYILLALIHKKRFETQEASSAVKMAIEFGASKDLLEHYLDIR